MPLWDFQCEACERTWEDVFCHSRDELVYCHEMKRKAVITDEDGNSVKGVEQIGCDSEEPMTKMISMPAPPKVHVGKHGSPAALREQAENQKKKMLKRSYDHEFKRGGKGVDERKATLEKLKKKRTPISGFGGF